MVGDNQLCITDLEVARSPISTIIHQHKPANIVLEMTCTWERHPPDTWHAEWIEEDKRMSTWCSLEKQQKKAAWKRWVAKEDLKYPAPSWRRHIQSEAGRQAIWNTLSNPERRGAWKNTYNAEKRLRKMQAALTPESSRYHQTFVRQGGWNRSNIPASDKAMARRQRRLVYLKVDSEKLLTFQLQTTPGCTYRGCVLGPISRSVANQTVILALYHHDHIDRMTKISCVTKLLPGDRATELAKTQVLCLWHHFLKTRIDLGLTGDVATLLYPELLAEKMRRGCQHPLHCVMPYASMVPRQTDDIKFSGFFHVSHVTRGYEHTKLSGKARFEMLLHHLISSVAVVHCWFCHVLYTSCERAMLHDLPFTQRQYEQLLVQHPAFVQHFHEVTAGFDWKSEKVRLSAKCSIANRNPKRKRSGLT